jgi:hypothetical protein
MDTLIDVSNFQLSVEANITNVRPILSLVKPLAGIYERWGYIYIYENNNNITIINIFFFYLEVHW